MPTPFPPSSSADTGVPSTCGDIRFVPTVTVEPVGESPDVPTLEPHPSIPDSPPTPPRRDESSLPLKEDPRSTHFIPEPVYPPYERLLFEGCFSRVVPFGKKLQNDARIYSVRQDRVGSEFNHRRFRDNRGAATRVGRAAISVDEYCKYPVFDARRFRAVSPVVGLEVDGRDGWVNNKDRAETWNQRWVHSSCRVPVPIHMDLKILWRTSERQYCERLGRMFQHYRVRNFSEKTPSEPDITLLCYGDSPSQRFYWFGQRTRFGSDAAQESRIRVQSLLRGSRSFMWAWNCDEFFDVPPGLRKELYPMALRTWGKYECPQYLCVPTPAVYAYYGSYVTLRAACAFANRRAEFVRAVGLTEFAASAVLCWLLAARDGVRYERRAPDPRLFPSGFPNFPSGRLFHLSAVDYLDPIGGSGGALARFSFPCFGLRFVRCFQQGDLYATGAGFLRLQLVYETGGDFASTSCETGFGRYVSSSSHIPRDNGQPCGSSFFRVSAYPGESSCRVNSASGTR